MQSMQFQCANVFKPEARAAGQCIQRIERGIHAGLTLQVRDQRQQADVEYGCQVGAVTLEAQDMARTRQCAGIAVTACA